MEINVVNRNNRYTVKKSFDESISNESLFYYYSPIVGKNTTFLYRLLSLESENIFINSIYVSLDRLLTLMDVSEETLKKLITKLEVVGLLTIYVNPAAKEKITFVINKPLNPTQFLANETLSKILKAKIGEENIIINKKPSSSKKFIPTDQDIMITKEIEIKASTDLVSSDINTSFDFSVIFDLLDKRNIDYTTWDSKIKKTISDAILIYDLSIMDIINVITTLNKLNIPIHPNTFTEFISENRNVSTEGINKAINFEDMTSESQIELLKTVQPTELIQILFERSATQEEINLLITLKDKHGLTNELINILIDHSKLINDAVIPNYIKKIASTITKHKLNEPEQLINHLKTAYKIKAKTNKSKNIEEVEDDFDYEFK